jgi:excisionase family DNA binding protein
MSTDPAAIASPWLTAEGAAAYAQCGVKLVYREIAAGRLRAARVGGRRDLRLLASWIDDWLIGSAPHVIAGTK